MKGLSAALAFVNASTLFALVAGILYHGLSRPLATFSIILGGLVALLAYRATADAPLRVRNPKPSPSPSPPEPKSKRQRRREERARKGLVANEAPRWRYRSIWFWLLAACFAIFVGRSFGWLIYFDGNEVKVQSPNNLGDLSLHLTYIRHFASGVPLWPDNPIEPFSKLRYPAGIDLFNAILTCLGVDVIRGLVWTGLIASVATFYALYRWGGKFAIAAFLFNGGLASYPFLQTFSFQDYQGANNIAWKSIALSMFVTQRGVLYAFPAGLLLLYQWRAKFFPDYEEPARVRPSERDEEPVAPVPVPRRAPLPLWLEVSLYATMPLYHSHTFIALSMVLAFLFVLGDGSVRKATALRVALALLPATFCVWITTDYFHAGSFIKWQPHWVQKSGDMAMPFVQFWLVNFGAWVPLVLFFVVITALAVLKQAKSPDFKISATVAFLIPAGAIFLLGYCVKLAPWEWDNIKIIVWAYLIILPFLWTDLLVHWPIALRGVLYVTLFASGLITLFGGLAAGKAGFGIADRYELDNVGAVVKKLPADARFAGHPIWGHPVLLQGRKMVLGYPGHLWTQGFDFAKTEEKLRNLMLGAPDWKDLARSLHARYLFWGRNETGNYAKSTRPWERESALVASGDWGAIYDLETPRVQTSPTPAPSVPRQ
ncbi:MAG: hypothetical protein M3N48_04665 [Verrucomicrobiota bacterium]|nr:hypothetical protein [Verrucomicrobiota bacterium]